MDRLNDWLRRNNMSVVEPSYIGGSTVLQMPEIGSCIYVKPNEDGFVLSEDFFLTLSDDDFALVEDKRVDAFVFEFGGAFYWSKIIEGKNKYREVGYIPKLNDLKYLGNAAGGNSATLCHLGVHSEYEILNGSSSAARWAKKASFLGVKFLGICDKNTLAGTLAFQTACEKAGIKPIIGETVKIAVGYDGENIPETFDMKLYAKTIEGWKNLLLINKAINVTYDGFIPKEELLELGSGIVAVFSLGSELNVYHTDEERCAEVLSEYLSAFDDVYYQIDSVVFTAGANQVRMYAALDNYLSKYVDFVKPILINDSYCVDEEEVCLKPYLNKISGIIEAQSSNQFFKTNDQTMSYFDYVIEGTDGKFREVVEQAMKNAIEMSEGVEFKIESGTRKLPKFEVEDVISFFYDKVAEGYSERLGHLSDDELKKYDEQLAVEFEVIVPNDLCDYFMILWDIMNWCRAEGINTGTGRGSVCGSLVAYLLHITDVDPLKYGLMFERFLNETRVSGERAKSADSMPDIDCDFPTLHRDEVKEYIKNKYGYDFTCSIGTYTRMKLKTCLKDFGKIIGLPFDVTNRLTKDIDDQIDYEWQDLFNYGRESKVVYDFIQKYPNVVMLTKFALNQPKAKSIHPSAVVITPKHAVDGSNKDVDIWQWLPIQKIDGMLVSEWEGKYIDKSGFLKEDILGLNQLDKFKDALDLIKANTGKQIDLNAIPLDQEEVFKYFKRGWNEDVFQFGTNGLMSYCKSVKPDTIEQLIAMTALFRPGPMELNAHIDFSDIKNGRKKPVFDVGMEDITKDTFGLYVYQEQIMKAVVVGGLTQVESDILRTTIKKKDIATLSAFGDKFKDGYVKLLKSKGVKEPEAYASRVWDKLLAFSSYGFNLSHAAAYTLMSYQSQWLKVNYPLEFWTASLQWSKESEVPYRLAELKKTGADIEVRPPDINISAEGFTCSAKRNMIFFSLMKIKFVGEKAASRILEERRQHGSFFSLEEFVERTRAKSVTKRVVMQLIIAGAFDLLEDIEHVRERKEIMRKYLVDMRGEDMPAEFMTPEAATNAFWIMEQKKATGYGNIDFESLVRDSIKSKRILDLYTDDLGFMAAREGKEIAVAGKVIFYVERDTKNGKMLSIQLDCNNTIIPVTFWPDAYGRVGERAEDLKGHIVALSGEVKKDKFKGEKAIFSNNNTRLFLIKITE